YQMLSYPISPAGGAAFPVPAFAFPFPAIPTLPDSFGCSCRLNSGGLWIGLLPFGGPDFIRETFRPITSAFTHPRVESLDSTEIQFPSGAA
ncbi:hypothetical protein, partial [Streptomyces sp. AK02-01A]|uniref:hypothetical protein n=1 Tax=Streptomyces sp. AK02-01A TaxID=3028648 RepID=UPI0029A95203